MVSEGRVENRRSKINENLRNIGRGGEEMRPLRRCRRCHIKYRVIIILEDADVGSKIYKERGTRLLLY